jgi:hypothetical protein
MKIVKLNRDGDSFPLTMHLEHEHTMRMGEEAHDTGAGDEVHFEGRGKVHRVEEMDNDGNIQRHHHIEITHMGMEREGGPPSLRDTVRKVATDKAPAWK